jgi:hypothetical protein
VRQAIWEKLEEIDLITFYKDADFQSSCIWFMSSVMCLWTRFLEYYEEVIFQRIENMTSLEAS